MSAPTGSPPGFISETRSPQIVLAREEVDPPSSLYIGVDDRLLVQHWSSATAETVTVDYRLLMPDGSINPGRFTLTTVSDRLRQASLFQLQEGFLLSLTVTSAHENVFPGQIFVNVQLVRGGAVHNIAAFGQILCAGYVSSLNSIGWPPGHHEAALEARVLTRTIQGTDPLPGVAISETVPTGAMWLMISFRFTLLTSAVVANRSVQLEFYDGPQRIMSIDSVVLQPAGSFHEYIYYVGATYANNEAGGDHIAPLPPLPIFVNGLRVAAVVYYGDAGDDFSGPSMVLQEWLSGGT